MDQKFMHPRALIIDDNPSDVVIAKFILENAGFLVSVADQGDKGLALATKNHYQLVVLDMQMPGISGLQVLQAIRANKLLEKIPVIIMSGRNREQDIRSALALGIQDYLIKPVDTKQFMNKLQSLRLEEKSDWFEYVIPDDSAHRAASISWNIDLVSINEMGCVITTPLPIAVGTTLSLGSDLFGGVKKTRLPCVVSRNDQHPLNKNQFLISLTFNSLSVEEATQIRLFCRQTYIAQKQKETQ